MKFLDICGPKGYSALIAFNTLMLGLKMLPSYMGETYEEFLGRIQLMDQKDQMKMIREAAMFVKLGEDELKDIVCFCTDKNGVPYTSENLKNLKPDEIIDVISGVCFKVSQFRVGFLTESEKKNLEISALT